MTISVRYGLAIGILLAVWTLSACGSLEEPPPTRVPTATITPYSTALPLVSTEVPAGLAASNTPLRLLIVPNNFSEASNSTDDLEEAIESLADVNVEVAVTSIGQAVDTLCSRSTTPTAIYANGIAYALVTLRNCGTPALVITDGDGEQLGDRSVIFVADAAEDKTFSAIAEGTFCRTSIDDIYSWLVPIAIFAGSNIDIADFNNVDEYEEYGDLINAVLQEQCNGAAVPLSFWEDNSTSAVDDINVSAMIQQGVLMLPNGLDIAVAEGVTDALRILDGSLEFEPVTDNTQADTQDNGDDTDNDTDTDTDDTVIDISDLDDAMNALFGDGVLDEVSTGDADLRRTRNVLNSTGFDFAELGQ